LSPQTNTNSISGSNRATVIGTTLTANNSLSSSNSNILAKKSAFETSYNKENSPYSSSSSSSTFRQPNSTSINSASTKPQITGNNNSGGGINDPINARADFTNSSSSNNNINRHTSLKKLSPFGSNTNTTNSTNFGTESFEGTNIDNSKMFSPPSSKQNETNLITNNRNFRYPQTNNSTSNILNPNISNNNQTSSLNVSSGSINNVKSLLNPNLTAATAAAAAAVEAAASLQDNKSKLMKSEHFLKRNSTFNEANDAVTKNINNQKGFNRSPTTSVSSNNNNINNAQLTPSPLSSVSYPSELVSKRTAIYQSKSVDDELKQPIIINRQANTTSNFRNKNHEILKDHSPVDDIEMLSTSPTSSTTSSSSSSSYKENKRPSPSQNLVEKLNNLNNPNSSELSSSGSSREPSKLSLSEKMKLFSVGTSGVNVNISNAQSVNESSTDGISRQKSLNKRGFNRFQTQVNYCF
jgi:hypothetical protein